PGGGGAVRAGEAPDVVRPVDRVDDRTAVNVGHRMQAILERGDDSDVAATTSQGPEQLAVVGLAGGEHFSVGGDDIGGYEVVTGQPVLAGEVTDAATEGKS